MLLVDYQVYIKPCLTADYGASAQRNPNIYKYLFTKHHASIGDLLAYDRTP